MNTEIIKEIVTTKRKPENIVLNENEYCRFKDALFIKIKNNDGELEQKMICEEDLINIKENYGINR